MGPLSAITLESLCLSYGQLMVVRNFSLNIPAGSLMAVVGPNGAGKSTLLKALAGLLKPTGGRIKIARDQVAYLPQQSEIERTFPITTYQLVAMGLWREMGVLDGLSKALHVRVQDALNKVGLNDFGDRPIAALSGGQLQRVLFARLMVQNAAIILLDEPFNAIDSKTVADLMHYIKQWHSEQRTIITVLHDLDQVKKQFSHSLLIAHELIAVGETSAVLTTKNIQQARQWCDDFNDRAPINRQPIKRAR